MKYELMNSLLRRDWLTVPEIKDEIQADAIQTWVEHFDGRAYETFYTGFGKTTIGVKAAIRYRKTFPDLVVIIVPTDDLKREWTNRLEDAGMTNFEVYIINTYTMSNKETIKRKCGLFIADELHIICGKFSQYFSTAIDITTFDFFLGLTATLDKEHVAFLFERGIREAYSVSLYEGIKLDLVPGFDIINVGCSISDAEAREYFKFNEEFLNQSGYFSSFAVNSSIYALASACGCKKADIYKKTELTIYLGEGETGTYTKTNAEWLRLTAQFFGVNASTIKNRAIHYLRGSRGRNLVLQRSTEKLKIAESLISNLNEKTISFFATKEQVDKVSKVTKTTGIHSTTKGNHAEIIAAFKRGDLMKLNTVRKFDLGLDVDNITREVNHSFTSKVISREQKTGRMLRLDLNNRFKFSRQYNLFTESGNEFPYNDHKHLVSSQKRAIGVKWVSAYDLDLKNL